MHLTALRALGGGTFPVGIKLIAEGAEEQSTGGLEQFVPEQADLLRAEAILVCDTGNFAVGVPTLTTTLRGLAKVTVPGVDASQTWPGVTYPPEQFRADANLLDGVELTGERSVSDMLWARPAVNVLDIDCPPLVGSAAALQPEARARVSMRVPPGMDPKQAGDALVAQLEAVAPWGAKLEIEREAPGAPLRPHRRPRLRDDGGGDAGGLRPGDDDRGPGRLDPPLQRLRDTFPEAKIVLMGVEEPRCLIHAPNESVDPTEIEHMSLVEALFLRDYAASA